MKSAGPSIATFALLEKVGQSIMNSCFYRGILVGDGSIVRAALALSIHCLGFSSIVNQCSTDPRSLGIRKEGFTNVLLMSYRRQESIKSEEGWGSDGVVMGRLLLGVYSWEKIRWRRIAGPCDYEEKKKKKLILMMGLKLNMELSHISHENPFFSL